MSGNLPDAIENSLLDALVGSATWTVTTPVMLRLCTSLGDDATPGTEVAGGSYAPKPVSFSTASGGSITNTAMLTFTGMPACTVVAVEVWDSGVSPKRLAYGALSESKTFSSGDSIQFVPGTITLSLN